MKYSFIQKDDFFFRCYRVDADIGYLVYFKWVARIWHGFVVAYW